jgi:hypothetical protein
MGRAGRTRRSAQKDLLDLSHVQVSALAGLPQKVVDAPACLCDVRRIALDTQVPVARVQIDIECGAQQLGVTVVGSQNEHCLVMGLQGNGDLGQGLVVRSGRDAEEHRGR